MSVITSPNLSLPAPALRSDALGRSGIAVGGAGRILALDGLRGFAVLLVFLIHATIIVPRSWPGVVLVSATFLNGFGPFLFFALSAYLITSILRRKRETPGYFATFYLSRGLRILPVYFLFIGGTLLVLPLVIDRVLLEFPGTTHRADWAYWLFVQNFIMGIYGTPQHKMLDVTWTLAVDLQFFIAWPAAVWFLSRKSLMRLCVGMIIVAPLFRVWAVFFSSLPHDAAYCFTPARLDALGLGALIAILADDRALLERLRPYARIGAGLAIPMVWTYLLIERQTGLRFNPTVIQSAGYFSRTLGDSLATLGAGCLVLCCITARPESLTNRVFGSPVMTYLGTRAYGFFLLHLPVVWIFRTMIFGPEDPTGAVQPLFAMIPVMGTYVPDQLLFYAMTFAVAIVLASLSYTLVERPIMRLKDRVLGKR